MARRDRRGSSPGRGRRRGSGGSDVDGEVFLVAFGDDGLHDGVQEVTVRMMVRLRITKASCSSVKTRPELDHLAATIWAQRRMASRRGSGGLHAYHDV
jgi:hypothetical protein